MDYELEIGRAADEIGDFLRKWGRVNVTQTKEKYGTARVYCSLGWYDLHSITHPGYHYSQYPNWLWLLNCRVFSRIVPKFNLIVRPYHVFLYRLAYKRAIRKYPHIAKAITCCADYRELLKPHPKADPDDPI